MSVGNDASLSIWRYSTQGQLIANSIGTPEKLEGLNFLTVEFTSYLPAPVNTYYLMIGTDDGSIVVFDQSKDANDGYVDLGMRQ